MIGEGGHGPPLDSKFYFKIRTEPEKRSANDVPFAKKLSLAPPRGISKHTPADGLINANTPWNHIPGQEQSAVLLATPILVLK